jgi:hypothetical protein
METTTNLAQQAAADKPPGAGAPGRLCWAAVGRYALGSFFIVLTLSYAGALVGGYVPEKQKVDAPAIVLLILSGICAILIIKPVFLKRLTKLKLGDVLEFELESIKATQKKHEVELDLLNYVLPLMLGDEERKHLLRLERRDTKTYVGSHDLKKELRKLRDMRLIVNPFGRRIADLKDNLPADIADYVRLTPFGLRWAKKLQAFEDVKANAPGKEDS